ncbi:hypothetical protein LXA43DRAFT_1097017 [Ganoderma leucocontextum]|nr:hypothetical protein LXA43DRAFT_1097017 [Ganoderma leucocontextum]
MTKKAKEDKGFQELQGVIAGRNIEDAAYVAEQSSGKCCVLAHKASDGQDVEEVVLQVQGFLTNLNLPPVRQQNIPRNLSRLTDLKQSVTLTGLGVESFDAAVRGVQAVHQFFHNHVSRGGAHLREWVPGRDGQDLTLTFANRYLMSSRDAAGETSLDMAGIIDPFNVLQPLLRGEAHLADNVVEYWERREGDTRDGYIEVKPHLFALTNLVEVQVGFMVIRVAHQEYVFVPKLRAICLFNRMVESDYNISTIRVLASGQLSPLKKVKRKVGYRTPLSDESGNDDIVPPSNKQLKCLTLEESGRDSELDRADVPMKDSA